LNRKRGEDKTVKRKIHIIVMYFRFGLERNANPAQLGKLRKSRKNFIRADNLTTTRNQVSSVMAT
jgi:hypothetical protein